MTLAVAAQEYIWLYDHRHGLGFEAIAAREDVSVGRVRFGVERAQAQERKHSKDDLIDNLKPGRLGALNFRLIPLFPIGPLTPQSGCPHHEPVKRGSSLCCMVCHSSGMDGHPGLRRDPLTEPSPESKPVPPTGGVAPSEAGGSAETRKQRRRRLFAEAMAAHAGL